MGNVWCGTNHGHCSTNHWHILLMPLDIVLHITLHM
jgi:hypothetical protein